MLKKIAIGLVNIVGLILALAATKPDSFATQRTMSIQAPPERSWRSLWTFILDFYSGLLLWTFVMDFCYGLLLWTFIVDVHNWPAWLPWEKLDPTMRRRKTSRSNLCMSSPTP